MPPSNTPKTVAASDETLARTAGTALHRQMFLVIRERIVRGEYPPSSTIPREEDLCASFGVSRITARRALADLETQGFVRRQQGRGTFVETDLPPARPAITQGFVDSLHKIATETDVAVLEVSLSVPPSSVAVPLQLESGERAVHALRLRSSGSVTLMVLDAWLPERFSKAVTTASLKKYPLYKVLMKEGIKYRRITQEITAVSANPAHARWLGTDVGMPLLSVTRVIYDDHGNPVQHLVATVSPERSRMVMNIDAETSDTLLAGRIIHDLGGKADVDSHRKVRTGPQAR